MDVLQELKEMSVWCDANPSRRKTRKGIQNFIINLLSKEQDKGTNHIILAEAKPVHEFVPTVFD